MTTQTFTNNSLAAYIGPDSGVVGVSGLSAMPDWEGSYLYCVQTSALGPGFRKFNIDASGVMFQFGCDEALQASRAAIGVAAISLSSGGAGCVGYNGQKLYFISNPGNSSQIAELNTSNLTLSATFGTSNNSTLPSTTTNILSPALMVPRNNAGSCNLLCGSASSLEEIDELQPGLPSNTNLGDLTEQVAGGAIVGPGGGAAGGHNAFALGLPFANGGAGSTAYIGVYKIAVGSITRVGQFRFSDVDATWTKIVSAMGCAYDETDGNIIVGVYTSDAVAHQQYIMKLSTTTGAILWKTAVNNLTAYSWSFSFARIRNGKFHYMGSGSLAYHITTSTGAVTTETLTGYAALGPQFSDDVTNSVICYATFTAGGSPPAYVGATMGNGGNHNVTTWTRFWFATAGGGGGGGNGGNEGGLTLSRKRAWTYTQDGHTFYVLDLGPEGTWLYDLLTKQWSQFITQGFGQWDVQAGTQWNQIRVVGGDLVTTDCWELVPSARQDHDGAFDISHTVSGELTTRSRVFHSVDAVRLTSSSGVLGNPVSAVINLRWSDDDGVTWSAFYPITVTNGSFNEVEWRSLGSFDAPGRVFEISDTGGPVRIDGCDAFVENFDDDTPQQQQ